MKVSKNILTTLTVVVSVGAVLTTTTSCTSLQQIKSKAGKTILRQDQTPSNSLPLGFDCPACGMG